MNYRSSIWMINRQSFSIDFELNNLWIRNCAKVYYLPDILLRSIRWLKPRRIFPENKIEKRRGIKIIARQRWSSVGERGGTLSSGLSPCRPFLIPPARPLTDWRNDGIITVPTSTSARESRAEDCEISFSH